MVLLSIKDLCAVFDVTKETLWRWRKQGDFPKPAKQYKGFIRWRARDIAAWANITEEELIQQIRSLRQEKSAGVGSTGTNDKSVTIKGQTNAKIQ